MLKKKKLPCPVTLKMNKQKFVSKPHHYFACIHNIRDLCTTLRLVVLCTAKAIQ